MLLDNETMFGDGAAYNASVTLDLGAIRPGPGKPIKCFFTTDSTLTGASVVQVLDAAVLPADEPVLAFVPPAVGATTEFELPSDVLQFVKLSITGASAGSFTAGIVMDVQTNL